MGQTSQLCAGGWWMCDHIMLRVDRFRFVDGSHNLMWPPSLYCELPKIKTICTEHNATSHAARCVYEVNMDATSQRVSISFKVVQSEPTKWWHIVPSVVDMGSWRPPRPLRRRIVTSASLQWRKSQNKCDITIQTDLTCESDRISAVQTVVKRPDVRHMWANRSDLIHFGLHSLISTVIIKWIYLDLVGLLWIVLNWAL